MAGRIELDVGEYDQAVGRVRTAAAGLQATAADMPGASGRSEAMDAFRAQFERLGKAINSYRDLVESDAAVLDAVRAAFVSADESAADGVSQVGGGPIGAAAQGGPGGTGGGLPATPWSVPGTSGR